MSGQEKYPLRDAFIKLFIGGFALFSGIFNFVRTIDGGEPGEHPHVLARVGLVMFGILVIGMGISDLIKRKKG